MTQFVAAATLTPSSFAYAEKPVGKIDWPFVGSDQTHTNVEQSQLRVFASGGFDDSFPISASERSEIGSTQRTALRRGDSPGWGGRH